jgi:hypothetical protein
MTNPKPPQMRRTAHGRAVHVRRLWWQRIRDLPPAEARAALLQMLADLDEHWDKEHEEDGLPEDLGIPPDEYLAKLVERIRTSPPPESSRDVHRP